MLRKNPEIRPPAPEPAGCSLVASSLTVPEREPYKGLFGNLEEAGLARTSQPGSPEPGLVHASSRVWLTACIESGQTGIVFGYMYVLQI
jgi:hypothetical protein